MTIPKPLTHDEVLDHGNLVSRERMRVLALLDERDELLALREASLEQSQADLLALGRARAELEAARAQVARMKAHAEEVMAEHDEETTGNSYLDTFCNIAMDAPFETAAWLSAHDAAVRAEIASQAFAWAKETTNQQPEWKAAVAWVAHKISAFATPAPAKEGP